MIYCSYPKPVYVHSYVRRRLGRFERVIAHCRMKVGLRQNGHLFFLDSLRKVYSFKMGTSSIITG